MFACGYMLHVGKFQPFEFRSRVTDKAGGSGVLFYSADKTPYVVRNRFLLGFFFKSTVSLRRKDCVQICRTVRVGVALRGTTGEVCDL